MKWYLIVVLSCLFLMTSDTEHFLVCLLSIWISSLMKCRSQVLHLFFNQVLCFLLLLSRRTSLIIFDFSPLSDTWFTTVFSWSVGCLFPLDSVVWCIKVNFDEVLFIFYCLSTFFLLLLVLWISYPRNHCQMQCHKVFPLFSSKSLIVLTVTCRSLIHFNFFVWWEVRVHFFFFFCHVGYLVFLAQDFEMTVISLLIGLDILVRNHLTIDARVYFWALYFIGLYIFQITFLKSLVRSSLVV